MIIPRDHGVTGAELKREQIGSAVPEQEPDAHMPGYGGDMERWSSAHDPLSVLIARSDLIVALNL
jgi:hypothetical protein